MTVKSQISEKLFVIP